MDGNNWPTDALPFKRTNLVIHLLNALLLFVLARKLLRILDIEARTCDWLAFVTAALWLLHPFLVSTTLYAVQRMAQLAMLFSVAGLITYLQGRALLATKPRKAYVLSDLGTRVLRAEVDRLQALTSMASSSRVPVYERHGIPAPALLSVYARLQRAGTRKGPRTRRGRPHPRLGRRGGA